MAVSSIYLDECMDYALIEPLRRRGFVVSTAQAENMRGIDDYQQLVFAAARGLTILSENKRHFRAWHRFFRQQGRPHGGILIIPKTEASLQALRTLMMLAWIGQDFPDHHSRLFIWGHLQEQLEQGRRLAGYTEAEVRRALGQQPP